MRSRDTNDDPAILALQALAWIVSEPARGERLLALTGLTPERLRAGAAEPAVLAAILGFLAAHEPDLIACAEAIGIAPERLAAAAGELER